LLGSRPHATPQLSPQILALKHQLSACLNSSFLAVENAHFLIESGRSIQGGIDVTHLQANRRCLHCKQPYESTLDDPDYLMSPASDMLCPACKQQYAADIMKEALQRSVQKLCMLQERRKKQ